jgi:hypothetical protein
MPYDKRLVKPQDYMDDVAKFFDKGAYVKSKYEQQNRADSTQPPFQINRFGASELRNRLTSRKPQINPRLNFPDAQPDNFNLFQGLPSRFDNSRKELYNFDEGRPVFQKPTFLDSIEFQLKGQKWKETYELSPTMNPEKRPKNPMPRVNNPDPKNYLFETMERKAKAEAEGKMNVAQLMKSSPQEIKEAEEKGPVK